MNLRPHVLRALDRVAPAKLPATALRDELELVLGVALRERDLEQVVAELRSKGYVDFDVPELGDLDDPSGRRWWITRSGQEALRGKVPAAAGRGAPAEPLRLRRNPGGEA